MKEVKSARPAAAVIAGAALALAGSGFALTAPEMSGPARDGSPGWHLVLPAPGAGRGAVPGGRGAGRGAADAGGGRGVNAATASQVAAERLPGCGKSTICGLKGGKPRTSTPKVNWDQNLGYSISYPVTLPAPIGGVPGAAVDSKGNLWALERNPAGNPQLFEFDKDYKLVRTISEEVTGHLLKAHALAVDPEDNVWFSDADGSYAMKLSPEGKPLLTLGTRGKRGDWDEAKQQRLLWQPVSIAFGLNNDVYIGEGHGNESPNDVDSDDPANVTGAARILHLDRNGKFINQWFGDEVGPGKFDQTHALAVDPTNGDVWIGDREQYRLVIYNGSGEFLRTLQMRNLTCGLFFDAQGQPWMASGQDGQILKIDRNGKVLGAIGGGSGRETGQFNEANYFSIDKQGKIYVGDTGIPRITVMTPPGKK